MIIFRRAREFVATIPNDWSHEILYFLLHLWVFIVNNDARRCITWTRGWLLFWKLTFASWSLFIRLLRIRQWNIIVDDRLSKVLIEGLRVLGELFSGMIIWIFVIHVYLWYHFYLKRTCLFSLFDKLFNAFESILLPVIITDHASTIIRYLADFNSLILLIIRDILF